MFGPKWRRWDLPTHTEWSALHYARFQHLLDEPFGWEPAVAPGFVAARIQLYNSQSEVSEFSSRLAKPSKDLCHEAKGEAGQSESGGRGGQPGCWKPERDVSLYSESET